MKKAVAMALTLCMAVSALAGCGGSSDAGQPAQEAEESTASGTTGETEAEAGGGDAAAENGEAAVSGEITYDFSDREPYTIKMMMFGDADTEQCEAVSAAVSEITREKINADVELTRVGFGSYVTQVNLALSAGEELDLFSPFSLSMITLANSGQILPMGDLLEEYGKETLAAISEDDWKCVSIEGEIYGVPINKDKASNLGFIMRKDILDEIGVSVDDIKDFDDFHDVLVKVKEAHPDMYPVVPDFASMWAYQYFDGLVDNFGCLNLSEDPNSTTIVNIFESDLYREWAERLYTWAQEGLVMPDASSNSEARTSLVKSGKAFGGFSHLKPGFDEEQSVSCGYEMVSWEYGGALSRTSGVAMGWCIGNNSGDPERAMALLNLMYNDPEISDLFINGVEGVHYEVKENGKIGYPEGKDATSVGYSRLAWGWPNEQISSIWESDKDTVWADLAEFNANATKSPAKGFTFDNISVMNEITACTNAYEKYHNAIIGGSLNPDEAIPQFNEELKAAGIDRIMEEKQRQLDAWLAENQ